MPSDEGDAAWEARRVMRYIMPPILVTNGNCTCFKLTIRLELWLVPVTLAGPSWPLASLNPGGMHRSTKSPSRQIVGRRITFVHAQPFVLVTELRLYTSVTPGAPRLRWVRRIVPDEDK